MNNDFCVPYEQTIEVNSLATAYMPFQYMCSLLDYEEALVKGTVFPELTLPYSNKHCCH